MIKLFAFVWRVSFHAGKIFLPFSLFSSDEYVSFSLLTRLMEVWAPMLTSIELFYLCSFFFSKVTPTNSVLSFFDTGSRKGIIGNLWVLLKLTCSLNQCGRGSSQFLGRHRWVSFFLLLVFVSASRGFYWVPRFSPLLKTNIPNSNSLWKVSPAGRGS